ncbi:MAG TPA: ABC transporter permease [Enteractinococcus sp.]
MTGDTKTTSDIIFRLENVLEDQSSVKPISPLMAMRTFAWRSVLKIKHVPEQLIDAVLFPVLFTLMFTFVFGGAIAGSPENYLQFTLPGILAQTVVFLTIYTAINVNTDISKGALDRFRTMPVWRPAHPVGALLADWLRYGIAAALCLVVGIIIGYRAEGGVAGVITAMGLLLVFSFALSWMWLVVGLKVRTATAVQGISFVILFPLTFVSSVYAPPETMPEWLQAFVNINPRTFLADAVRGLMSGTVDGTSVVMVLVVSAIITVVFAPIALWVYNNLD